MDALRPLVFLVPTLCVGMQLGRSASLGFPRSHALRGNAAWTLCVPWFRLPIKTKKQKLYLIS
ncbi:MAG: hypothetical protein GY749_01600 [Desulfobacteraceae bacterium]|nr:hypothetical protein [Desulfobacteraceae bacterium]